MKRETALSKSMNMGKIWLSGFTFAIIILSGSVSFALDPLGPPVANLEPGQFHIGVDYYQNKMDLQIIEWTGIQYIYGSFEISGTIPDPPPIENFKQNSSYINFGYGIDYNWGIFVRLSSTKAEFGDLSWQKGEEFESESVPMFGGGIKATLYEDDYLKIGGLVQANWSHYNGILNTPLWEAPHFVEIDFTEIQITLGATYMLYDGIWIYGGPLAHFIDGEINELYAEEADIGGLGYWDWSSDIEQDSMYGGYIGTTVDIDEFNSLNFEYQFTGSANAFGASYVMKF